MFFFFISWNVQLWSACKYLWWRLVLCGDQTIDLQDVLIGWFLYGLGIRRGYFRTDYSIVVILEAAFAKYPFVFITAAMSYWWLFRLLACSLLKSSFVNVFILFFSTYSTGVYFDDFFRWMYFLLQIVLYPQDTLA